MVQRRTNRVCLGIRQPFRLDGREGYLISLAWDEIFAWSCVIGAVISGAQIILLRTGSLTRFYLPEDEQPGDEIGLFSTDLGDVVDPLTVISLASRAWMYALLFLSADIGFVTWVISSLLMTLDG